MKKKKYEETFVLQERFVQKIIDITCCVQNSVF